MAKLRQGGVHMMVKVLMAVLVISALVVMVSIALQPSKTNGLNSLMTGTSETFFSKNKTKTRESFLARLTIISSIIFALSVIFINIQIR